ncbi:Predicted phosphohydrolase [Rubritalea squalenifaciens DSM 18772]|uniref:Predicted phosphohydrolase n=1 Tax=Rubritalea squalenifaciens DSM 18772 TaxID=1123071 RepID=A0A1M6MDN5_9BACT|nr:metallophosphoesterase [Rubritalea squalenifaciens]SHJ81530.1 Predicted phosphohydrolase [Rubritalea squalenifaciens DSM 18772]
MRIHVLSDLHLEFGSFDYPKVDADLVVLAGDTHVKLNGAKWAIENIPDVPTLYILGNHEYYGEKLPKLSSKLKELCEGTNIHILENNVFEHKGYRFFGATLWTDMSLHGDPLVGGVEALRMNDYKRIRHSSTYRKLRPIDTQFQHAGTISKMTKFMESGDPANSIIITHHAPSIRSLPHQRRNELISCAYTSHLDDLVEELNPLLWIHGHIHHSQDYNIGKTRILSNPRAYVDSPNTGFEPELVIDLEDELERYRAQ